MDVRGNQRDICAFQNEHCVLRGIEIEQDQFHDMWARFATRMGLEIKMSFLTMQPASSEAILPRVSESNVHLFLKSILKPLKNGDKRLPTILVHSADATLALK